MLYHILFDYVILLYSMLCYVMYIYIMYSAWAVHVEIKVTPKVLCKCQGKVDHLVPFPKLITTCLQCISTDHWPVILGSATWVVNESWKTPAGSTSESHQRGLSQTHQVEMVKVWVKIGGLKPEPMLVGGPQFAPKFRVLKKGWSESNELFSAFFMFQLTSVHEIHPIGNRLSGALALGHFTELSVLAVPNLGKPDHDWNGYQIIHIPCHEITSNPFQHVLIFLSIIDNFGKKSCSHSTTTGLFLWTYWPDLPISPVVDMAICRWTRKAHGWDNIFWWSWLVKTIEIPSFEGDGSRLQKGAEQKGSWLRTVWISLGGPQSLTVLEAGCYCANIMLCYPLLCDFSTGIGSSSCEQSPFGAHHCTVQKDVKSPETWTHINQMNRSKSFKIHLNPIYPSLSREGKHE